MPDRSDTDVKALQNELRMLEERTRTVRAALATQRRSRVRRYDAELFVRFLVVAHASVRDRWWTVAELLDYCATPVGEELRLAILALVRTRRNAARRLGKALEQYSNVDVGDYRLVRHERAASGTLWHIER